MLLQRMDNQIGWENPSAPEKPSIAARRMWYDTVGHTHRPALRAAVESLGADRLVLGTDFPYESGELFKEAVRYISDAQLAPADARKILDVNAATLLGLT
jgi:6-methylsalicylate decarboxylase